MSRYVDVSKEAPASDTVLWLVLTVLVHRVQDSVVWDTVSRCTTINAHSVHRCGHTRGLIVGVVTDLHTKFLTKRLNLRLHVLDGLCSPIAHSA